MAKVAEVVLKGVEVPKVVNVVVKVVEAPKVFQVVLRALGDCAEGGGACSEGGFQSSRLFGQNAGLKSNG